MSGRLTTASGRMVDLLAPSAADVDFDDIAEHLAKENRFNGATPGAAYSVAQHSVLGAMHLLRRRQQQEAAYFLCHDFHEAYLKDDTTPKKWALDQIAAQFGVLAGSISGAFAALTDRWDTAIHEAAGLAWPPPPAIAARVKALDKVLLYTEWRDLMRQAAAPFEIDPWLGELVETITPWDWPKARAALRLCCDVLLPTRKDRR